MDEPMEEETGEHKNNDESKAKSSMLRPGSMVMMSISPEDYQTQYWPKLQSAIDQLLTMSPGEYIPISYEQMYSCVYKCVCKQLSEKLYSDLITHITTHLEKLCKEIQNTAGNVYINNFHYALQQYLTALLGIVPIFNYMNRFYVELKLKTNLNEELRKLFVECVADKHIQKVIPVLIEASTKPFYVSPPVMANLVKNLHSLKPEYSSYHPLLFAKYIPSILPPCSEVDMDMYQAEVRQMQRDLLTHPDFIRGDQGRKRAGEDDPQKTTAPASFFPKTS